MEEVELLQEQDTSVHTIARHVEIKKIKKQVATAIVNGQVVDSQQVENIVLVCPNCHAVLNEFQHGISGIEVYRQLSMLQEKDEDKLSRYCSCCGQRLKYIKESVI